MLRIAMLSYHTCPLATLGGKDTGGMNVYVRELTRHLGQLGVHVDVFTRSQDEHIPCVLHDLGYGNRVVHIAAGDEVPMSKPELTEFIPQFARGILEFAAEKNLEYDIIHSHYWMSGIAASILKEKWHIPIIHMFHTLGLMKNRIARNESETEGDYRKDGENRVIHEADRIVAATRAEKSQLQFLYNADVRKVVVIPPGVDLAHFYHIPSDEAKDFIGIPKNDCMLLYVGRIEPLKGIEVLIRALAHINQSGVLKECPHYLAVIGGDPNPTQQEIDTELSRLQKLCTELGIGDMVLFLGKRSQDTLPYYYSAAEMVIVPSHYESFGMVALEAMACATPVVASQVGGLAYLIEDGKTGFMVPDDDYLALADKLTSLICNPQMRLQMGKNAAERALPYSWHHIADQMHSLYQNILTTTNEQLPLC